MMTFTNETNRNLLIAAVTLPVIGWLIYRSLTPSQKKRFKKAFVAGSSAFASQLLDRAALRHRARTGGSRTSFAGMAAIPNPDESETTIGDEKW